MSAHRIGASKIMAIHKLPANFVETVRKKGLHNDGGGLNAQIGEGGKAKSWIFRYRFNGRQREMGHELYKP
jgi:hypothetical protein